MASNAPNIAITYNQILFTLLGFFGFISLLRARCAFGWAERVAMLIAGVAATLTLAGIGNVPGLPLLSSDMQQVTGNIFSVLSVDQAVATCILAAALLSLLWLTRSKFNADRAVLGVVFGSVSVLALVQYIHVQHVLLLIALILLTQGVLIAVQIESVRRGNRPY